MFYNKIIINWLLPKIQISSNDMAFNFLFLCRWIHMTMFILFSMMFQGTLLFHWF